MPANSPIDSLPTLRIINARLGSLYRELTLLRRLMRLAQAAEEHAALTAEALPTAQSEQGVNRGK